MFKFWKGEGQFAKAAPQEKVNAGSIASSSFMPGPQRLRGKSGPSLGCQGYRSISFNLGDLGKMAIVRASFGKLGDDLLSYRLSIRALRCGPNSMKSKTTTTITDPTPGFGACALSIAEMGCKHRSNWRSCNILGGSGNGD